MLKTKITINKKNKSIFILKKALIFPALVFVLFIGVFSLYEPEILKAVTDTVLVSLDITSEITISAPGDVTLSSIPGMTGGSSTSGAVTWTVVTNDTDGYTLKIEKDHLLQKGVGANQTIADYTEAAAGTPDLDWAAVGAGNEEFGFAPSAGADIVQKFKNATGSCNQAAGSVTDLKCWSPIPTTGGTAETIATNADQTGDSGTATAIKVKAEVGSGNHLEEGTFTSTITATATTN